MLRGVLAATLGLIVLTRSRCPLNVLGSFVSACVIVDLVFSTTLSGRDLWTDQLMSLRILGGATGFAVGAIGSLWPPVTLQVLIIALASWSVLAGSLKEQDAVHLPGEVRGKRYLIADGISSMLSGTIVVVLVVGPSIHASVLIGSSALALSVFLFFLAAALHRIRDLQPGAHPLPLSSQEAKK